MEKDKNERLKTGGKKRSPKWAGVRKAFLKKHPRCAVCGGKIKLQAHHIVPFSIAPDKELQENNLITLCEAPRKNCHFQFGHLYSWRSYNTDVVNDAKIWYNKIRRRP